MKYLLAFFALTITFSAQAQWNLVPDVPETFITGIAYNNNTLFATADTNLIFRSEDNGENWEVLTVGNGSTYFNAISCFENVIYAGTTDAGIFISHNNGESWISSGSHLLPIVTFAHRDGIVYAATLGNGVAYLNQNNTWSYFNNSLPTYSHNIYSMVNTPDNLVISGGGNGVFYTYDFANNKWVEGYFLNGTLAPGLIISDMAYDEGTIFAASRIRLFRSDDGALSWQEDQNGVHTGVDRRVYAGSKNHYLVTNIVTGGAWIQARDKQAPAGTAWSLDEEFLPFLYVFDIMEFNNKIYLATDRGLFFKNLMPTGIPEPNPSRPTVAIFPNPASNGIVNIKSSEIIQSMRLFDENGKCLFVKTVDAKETTLETGLKGHYFLQVENSEGYTTGKLLILGQ